LKVSKILKILKDDVWFQVRQRGSHVQLKHSTKKGLVTVSFHRKSDEIAPGTMNSILKQSQISLEKNL
jgi:predicted RNA binding protein YcfA (HicA-like mRNA interferase family)